MAYSCRVELKIHKVLSGESHSILYGERLNPKDDSDELEFFYKGILHQVSDNGVVALGECQVVESLCDGVGICFSFVGKVIPVAPCRLLNHLEETQSW